MKKQGNVTNRTYVRTFSNAQLDKMNKQELIHVYGVLRNAHFEICKDKDNDIQELEQQLDGMSDYAYHLQQQADKLRDEVSTKTIAIGRLLDKQWYLMVPQLFLALYTALKVLSMA